MYFLPVCDASNKYNKGGLAQKVSYDPPGSPPTNGNMQELSHINETSPAKVSGPTPGFQSGTGD